MTPLNTDITERIQSLEEICSINKPLVVVFSMVYNHQKYLHDALEGFIKQQTRFPFIVIVHDDASTDSSAKIIKEYAHNYPNIIFPVIEMENQYSKQIGSLNEIMGKCCEATKAKYIALCEGDDYWTDPLKLQKQVDFLEKNPSYTLVTTNYLTKSADNPPTNSKWNVSKDKDLSIKDIILNGGLFLATASLVFRSNIYKKIPSATKKLHVGDYPLQIFMASKGQVRQLADPTCVYRIQSVGSWTQKNNANKYNYEIVKERIAKEVHLLETMNRVTEGKYPSLFQQRKVLYTYNSLFLFSAWKCLNAFCSHPLLILKHNSYKHILLSFLPKGIKQKYLGK